MSASSPCSKLLLIDQVAEGLGVSTRTVRRLIARGELVACRLGRSVRVHPDDPAAYIDRRRGDDHVRQSVPLQLNAKNNLGNMSDNISSRWSSYVFP
jgi:excisionase family DNA binding protein